jgi:hypothetical protein
LTNTAWAKITMTPIRGRCPVGQRLVAKVPHGHRKTLTFVAALRCDGICAPCLLDQPINAVSFRTYIRPVAKVGERSQAFEKA